MSIPNKVEDWDRYKALNLPLGLFGPTPRLPSSCICGRFIVDDYCACATSCWDMPKHKWVKENPELYKAEQEEERAAMRRYQFWTHQRDEVGAKIWKQSKHIVQEFERLKDMESAIGCHTCEKHGEHSCRCMCDSCGSKWCDGTCRDDMEYLG